MTVLVVQIGAVRMGVPQRRVPVPMRMWLGHRPVVMVLVVRVVDVDVDVLMPNCLVDMLVLVPLREVQPQADPISAPATTSCAVTGSRSSTTVIAAPMKGASEK